MNLKKSLVTTIENVVIKVDSCCAHHRKTLFDSPVLLDVLTRVELDIASDVLLGNGIARLIIFSSTCRVGVRSDRRSLFFLCIS